MIILLTDGNEQPPETRLIDPNTALEITKTKSIKVYTIGMGATGTHTVAEKGVNTRSNAFLDEALLKQLEGTLQGLRK